MENKYTELYEKLSRLQWLLQRHHIMGHAEGGPMADPTRGQGRVLAMLKLQPEMSSKDLAYLLGIRQQSLNELLNKLEKNGYISRAQSEADKRVIMIKLTEKGKQEHQEKQDYSGIFDCLNEEERDLFSDYLDRVIAALETKVGNDGEEADFEWMAAARERMGDKQFSRLMAMKRGGHPRWEDCPNHGHKDFDGRRGPLSPGQHGYAYAGYHHGGRSGECKHHHPKHKHHENKSDTPAKQDKSSENAEE